ncbi:MAG: Ig-like domain-containing protein [Deltaproteobacteria bacterium]|nr:Ig-like domain-containing protein [Deltaproteobacteria bacterium]
MRVRKKLFTKLLTKLLVSLSLSLATLVTGCGGSDGGGGVAGTTTALANVVVPTVSSTNPADGDVGVFINRKVTAVFSEDMDPATIDDTVFVLNQGSVPVSGVVTASGNAATFTPTGNLGISTVYTATITTGATSLAGNGLAASEVWSFTTGTTADSTAPTVSSTNPVNAATGVAINSTVAASFSEEMDPLTLTTSTFQVSGPDSVLVAGTVSYALVGNVATFTPTSSLAVNTLFTATISTGAKDLAGNALDSSNVWSFTTGAVADSVAPTVSSTNPADADVSVALNKTISATFSESMNAATITTANYTLAGPGAVPVTGTVDYVLATNIVTFTPASNLAPSTLFTATISTGAKDLAGNALASNKVWTFTSGTEAAQTVAQTVVPLGSSSTFAILASAAITSIPTSSVIGDIGLTPDAGSNLTGLTCSEITGTVYVTSAGGSTLACQTISASILDTAKTDAATAFTNARDAVRGTPASISGNLNGLTLYPGLYESGTSLEISAGGILYLDAQGDADAIFVIRSETSITTLSTSQIVLTKGAKANNVYWTAGSAVTLGANSIMKGTFIAGTALTLQTGANLEGRALNQGASAAAISLDASTITVPSP